MRRYTGLLSCARASRAMKKYLLHRKMTPYNDAGHSAVSPQQAKTTAVCVRCTLSINKSRLVLSNAVAVRACVCVRGHVVCTHHHAAGLKRNERRSTVDPKTVDDGPTAGYPRAYIHMYLPGSYWRLVYPPTYCTTTAGRHGFEQALCRPFIDWLVCLSCVLFMCHSPPIIRGISPPFFPLPPEKVGPS